MRSEDWRDAAACRGVANADDWFAAVSSRATRRAKAVCRTCPVREACRAYALATGQPWGVWGGKTAQELGTGYYGSQERYRHIGRTHVRYVLATQEPEEITTNRGEQGWLYIGPDDRGLVLEVIAVEVEGGDLLVIHAMPQTVRGGG